MVEKANAVATMAPMLAKRRSCDVGFISFSPIGVALSHLSGQKIHLIFCHQWTCYFYLYQASFSVLDDRSILYDDCAVNCSRQHLPSNKKETT
jgi:hypothetical protein